MTDIDTTTGEIVRTPAMEAALERYDAMILSVPAAADDDGLGMVLGILNAASWEDVNLDDKLPALKDLVGRTLRISGVERRQGDDQYGKGWYLIAEATDAQTRKPCRFQTSAGVPMAQLVALHNLGAFPAVVEVTSTKTKNNQVAVNLVVKAASGGKK